MDLEERWDRLLTGLVEAAQVKQPAESDVGRINGLLGSLNLIQPFSWRTWDVPFPQRHEISELSIEDCVKQITRLSRADRTQEGILWMTVRSGVLLELCETAKTRAAGVAISSLAEMSSGE